MPRLFSPSIATGEAGHPPGGWVVLAPGPIPTIDYYFLARSVPARRVVDVRARAPDASLLPDECGVVIVRHAPRAWLRLLARERSRLQRVAYFLDDDLPGALWARELPPAYAARTGLRFLASRAALARVCDAVWVSTPELARRYPEARAQVLEPLYVDSAPAARDADAPPSYFYHGTWAHRREIAWLVPVVREVQRQLPEARFDVCGGETVRRLFRGITNVHVRAPQPWPRYRSLADGLAFDLGLAPCLDTPFNRARSHVKLIDITRFGAAGIYSRGAPYDAAVREGETGLRLDNEPGRWAHAIVRALRDRDGCAAVRARALAWCLERRRVAGTLQ